jgi:hypothetical protein
MKPRRVIAKITRTVTEKAVVTLDRDGCIEEVEDIHEEFDWEDGEVLSTYSILSVHP